MVDQQEQRDQTHDKSTNGNSQAEVDLRRLETILNVSAESRDIEAVYRTVATEIRSAISYDRFAISDPLFQTNIYVDGTQIHSLDAGDEIYVPRPLPDNNIPAEQAIELLQPSTKNQVDKAVFNAGLRTRIRILLGTSEQPLGLIAVMSNNPEAYTTNDVEHLRRISRAISPAIRAAIAIEEIDQHERDYRDLVDTSEELIWRCDSEGRWISLNPAWKKVLGYEIDEMLGRPFTDFMEADIAEIDLEEFARMLEGGSVRGYRTEYLSKSGETVTLSFNADVVIDGSGVSAVTRGTAREITAEIENERITALLGSLEQLTTSGGIEAHSTSGEVRLSSGFTNLFGYESKDFSGHSIDKRRETIHPDDRELATKQFQWLENNVGIHRNIHFRQGLKNGGYLWVQSYGVIEDDEHGPACRLRASLRVIEKEREANRVQTLISAAVNATADMVLIANADGIIEQVNPAFEKETGYSANEAVGKSTIILKSGNQNERYYEVLWRTILQGNVWTGQLINRRKDGTEYEEEMSITPIKNERGEITNYVAIKRNVSERVRHEKELVSIATTDSLTGLSNRHHFNAQLRQAHLQSRRTKKPSSLLLVDIDAFKFVNDTYGHSAGDTVLTELAQTLRKSVRASDIVARYGGDEFALILLETGAEDARNKSLQIMESVNDLVFSIAGESVSIGVSIGITQLVDTDGPDDAVVRADIALYQSKEAGRGFATVYDLESDAGEQITQAQKISNILRSSDLAEQLVLYSQRIQPIQEGLPEIREILSRLRDGNGELIPPDQFIAQAEAIDMMDDVDRQVITNTLRFMSEEDSPVLTSVNISGRFVTPVNANWIVETFSKSSVDPEKIIFEITETALARDAESIAQFLSTLKSKGFKLAMDDFGAGVTTFHHLRQIEFDYLKLDGSIVRETGHNHRDRELVWGLAGLARTLGLQVVAEFVQDAATMHFLGEAGIEYAQGYFIAKPEPLTNSK